MTGQRAGYWAPPPREEATGHRISLAPGRRPIETRYLPGPRPAGLGRWAWWRIRLALWLAEYPMRWAARGMARLPVEYAALTEAAPLLDGCTCGTPIGKTGSHRPGCIWSVAR